MLLKRSVRTNITVQVVLTIVALIFAAPLIITFVVSLQGEGFVNYLTVLQNPQIPRFFLNSLITTSCTIVLVYFLSLSSAYAFSKLEIKGKTILFNAVLVGLMLPGVAILVPLFLTIKQFSLFDNYLALIIPYTAFNLPFNILLMRNFLDGLPNELLDAAKIDGCTSWTALLKIVVPLSKPITVVVVIWTFLSTWNEFFFSLVFMRSQDMQTITRAPSFYVGVYGQDTGKIFASLVLISLPIIVLYLSLQKYFEGGMTSGAIK